MAKNDPTSAHLKLDERNHVEKQMLLTSFDAPVESTLADVTQQVFNVVTSSSLS